MKKYFLLFLIFFSLFGCSSLELEAVSSSEEETQRILALGLSHEENLTEAKKLSSNHMISVVTLQLINARDEKIQSDIVMLEANNFAEMVSVLSDGDIFEGPEVTESLKTGVLNSDIDIQDYYLEGIKSTNNIINHKLKVKISHNSRNSRNYSSASLCDEWSRCDNNKHEIIVKSFDASNCSSGSCDYEEIMELSLSDDFLRSSIDKGFTFRFISKRKSNKIKVSKAYLMGYLMVAR
jgi:hypothetical protein